MNKDAPRRQLVQQSGTIVTTQALVRIASSLRADMIFWERHGSVLFRCGLELVVRKTKSCLSSGLWQLKQAVRLAAVFGSCPP